MALVNGEQDWSDYSNAPFAIDNPKPDSQLSCLIANAIWKLCTLSPLLLFNHTPTGALMFNFYMLILIQEANVEPTECSWPIAQWHFHSDQSTHSNQILVWLNLSLCAQIFGRRLDPFRREHEAAGKCTDLHFNVRRNEFLGVGCAFLFSNWEWQVQEWKLKFSGRCTFPEFSSYAAKQELER